MRLLPLNRAQLAFADVKRRLGFNQSVTAGTLARLWRLSSLEMLGGAKHDGPRSSPGVRIFRSAEIAPRAAAVFQKAVTGGVPPDGLGPPRRSSAEGQGGELVQAPE
jgi:hypothetical protein